MNSSTCIWSEFPLETGIAALICYAGVFNDVIGVEELASRLGVSGQDEFYTALNELHLQRRLILKDGFAGLPDLENKIAIKASQIAMAQQLINSRIGDLHQLGKNPLVRFVGISGSLAAHNPTRDGNNHLDIDIFLITRKQCLWPYNILRGLRNLFPRSEQEPQLCINYVMDESSLMITNRNFYTATEVRNLIPVLGLGVYRQFLQVNSWVDYYYPGFTGASASIPVTPAIGLVTKSFYILYIILKSFKRLSAEPLRTVSFRADPGRGIDFNLICHPYGGYQAMVQKRFGCIAGTWFPELLPGDLIDRLFPDELSAEIRRGRIDVAAITINAGIGHDYSKYGYGDILPKSG